MKKRKSEKKKKKHKKGRKELILEEVRELRKQAIYLFIYIHKALL